MSRAVLWSLRHFAYEVEVFDSVEAAADAAVYHAAAGTAAFDHIEHSGGQWVGQEDPVMEAAWRRFEQSAHLLAQRVGTPETLRLEVRHLDGAWVQVCDYAEAEAQEAEQDLATYAEAMGTDRVRLVPIKEKGQ